MKNVKNPLVCAVVVGLFGAGVAWAGGPEVHVWEGVEFIPDFDPLGATVEILVPNDPGASPIADLDVDMIVEHSWQGDIRVELTHVNSGLSAVLMDLPGDPDFPGGFGVPNLGDPLLFEDFLFDDEAALAYDFPFVAFPGTPNPTGSSVNESLSCSSPSA